MALPPVDSSPSAPADGSRTPDWASLTDQLLDACTADEVLRLAGAFLHETLAPVGLRLAAWRPDPAGAAGAARDLDHPRRIPGFFLENGKAVSLPLPVTPEAWAALPSEPMVGSLPGLLQGGAPEPEESTWVVHPLAQPRHPADSRGENEESLPDRRPTGLFALCFPTPPPQGEATLALVSRLATLARLRIHREDDLAEIRRQHADLLRSVPIPLFVCDAQGQILEANPAFLELFCCEGFPRCLPELHVEPEDCFAWLDEAVRGGAVRGHRVRLHGPDNTELGAEISAAHRGSGVRDDLRIEGALVDVTRQLDAEQEARIFTSALVQTDGAVCIADRGGRIRFVNPSFEAMSGYRQEELLGCPFDSLGDPPVPPGSAPPPSELLDRLLGGEVVRQERTATRSDGEEYTEARTVTPIRDARGRITHLISVSRDITSTRRLERQFHQAQKLEAVGRLAGGVAHDFNNLLTVIHGHVQLILMQLDPESPIRGDLEGMVQAGNRASALVQQLLTFARREPSPVSGPLALGAVLSAMESLLQRLIGENLELTVEIEDDLPPVEIDRIRLEQVLANLVVNARDAMPRGGRIHIRAWWEPPRALGGARQVFLSVEDSGMGIPLAIQERIFEPFFTTKEDGGGSGLGLATVYGIVRQAGGTVQVESEPGKGATFIIQFAEAAPRSSLEAEGPDPRGSQSPHADHRGTERILLVEDHDLVRSITCSILRDQGYSVDEATTGEEALQLLGTAKDAAYDLVITDLLMRGMGGERLAAALRSRDPAYPLLFISGYRGSSDSAPVDIPGDRIDVIPKPFTVPELIGAVRKVVEAGRGRTEVRKPG